MQLAIEYLKKATSASMMVMLLVMLLVMILPSTVAHSGDVMYAPPLTVPVTIDGVWSTGEWDDAPQYTMMGNRTGYIRAKFNSTHLFVLIDLPWDTTNASIYWHENVWLAFDTAHDGGAAPQWGDYLIHASTEFSGMGYQGNTTDWANQWLGYVATTAQTGDWSNTTDARPPGHRTVEMAVALTYVGSAGSAVGFYAQADDDSSDPDGADWQPATAYSEWPSTSGGSPGWPNGWGTIPTPAPNAWGDLILHAPVGGITLTVDKLSLLAPYIALVSMIAVAGATAIYIIRRKKLR